MIVLKLSSGATRHLTERFGDAALCILEDALNRQGAAYVYTTTHKWRSHDETVLRIVAPQLHVSLRAVKSTDSHNSYPHYYYAAAAEKVSRQDIYEAWAHPLTTPVIVLRENEPAIIRCSACTRPLPSGRGRTVEKCPSCLHQYLDDTAVVRLDSIPVTMQFDITELAPISDASEERRTRPHPPETFGIALHPNVQEHFNQLPRQEAEEVGRLIAAALKNRTFDRLKLKTGAYIILPNPADTQTDAQTTTTPLSELDQKLRETGIGYLLDPYELKQAQARAVQLSHHRQGSGGG
jgi:hypothetical protein